MRDIFAYLTVLFLVCCHTAFAADKIKNCDAKTETALKAVNDYISSNLNDFLQTDALFIPTKHKDKLKKKWPKTTLKCSNADDYCNRKNFDAFQNVGNVVRYCTKEIDIPNAPLCDLVGLTMHEMGHAADIPMSNKHNHAGLYAEVSDGTVDLVYRFGKAAKDYCYLHPTADLKGMTSVTVAAKTIGATCDKNDDCNSGKCQGTGTRRECVCKDDTDCPDGRCQNRLGKNYCVAKGMGPGDFCKKDIDCGFGKCEHGNCVCKTDADCKTFFGDNTMRCASPITKKNFCQPTNQPAGASCQNNSDCSANLKCKKNACSS